MITILATPVGYLVNGKEVDAGNFSSLCTNEEEVAFRKFLQARESKMIEKSIFPSSTPTYNEVVENHQKGLGWLTR